MAAKHTHAEPRPGGESTNSTLVSLYLILLSFFIAMQAILGADPVPLASTIAPVTEERMNSLLVEGGDVGGATAEYDIVEDIEQLARNYPGLEFTVKDQDLLSIELSSQTGFFFSPEGVQIRLDRLQLLEELQAIADRASWNIGIYLPLEDDLKNKRLSAFHEAFAGSSPRLGVHGLSVITMVIEGDGRA